MSESLRDWYEGQKLQEEMAEQGGGTTPTPPKKSILSTPNGALTIKRVSNGWCITAGYTKAYPGYPWDITYKLPRHADTDIVFNELKDLRAFVTGYIDGLRPPSDSKETT